MEVSAKYRDPLCRFTPTPLAADLRVMDRTVLLETNSPAVLGQTVRLFERYQAPPSSRAELLWRIVGEGRSGLKPPWPEMTAFSDDALRYVNLGQQNFFAVDLEAREAVAFLSEDLAMDDLGFSSVFLATLFDLTAAALRLTQISAACVAMGSEAVLIFGPPGSGKTSSTYLAGKLGLEFHADQVTFLELKPDGVHAWGQFWPAAFREDTSQFLPELARRASRVASPEGRNTLRLAVLPLGADSLKRRTEAKLVRHTVRAQSGARHCATAPLGGNKGWEAAHPLPEPTKLALRRRACPRRGHTGCRNGFPSRGGVS